MNKLFSNLLAFLSIGAANTFSQACFLVFWDEEEIPDCLIK
ncbi:MAG: cyclic lactone autoinducer peptide [Bacilli bacterium]|nr:cyclic lactone autoinducer peptide [Bacilli bacterium]MDD4607901.1 cyclic lactone autoinducer peptide [Bacilli bacterium]